MKRIINQLVITSLVFLLTQLFLMAVLNILHMSYFDSGVWLRWDSGHYLTIANEGYEFFPCAGKFGYPLDATDMCGNTGWFPGYPFLIKLLSYIIADTTFLGGFLSKVFYFMSLFLILVISGIDKISVKNIIYLSLPAFSFGFIYYNAIFPISTVLFFSLLGFYFFFKRKIWLTGLCCTIVSFLYPTGFLLSFVFAISIFIREEEKKNIRKISKCLIPLFFGGIGVVLAFLVYQIQVDNWAAFIQVQSKYGHSFHNPIKSVGKMLSKFSFNPFTLINVIIIQSVLVIIGYFSLSYYFFTKKLYRTDLYLVSYLYVSLFFLFPWIVGGNLSMYRAESLLFPFVFLLKDLKISWNISILTIMISIGGIMSYFFFTKVLV